MLQFFATMSPLVRLVGGEGPTKTVSVSLEHTELVLADLRAALPGLEEELRKKWPTLVRVRIEDVVPRRRPAPLDADSFRKARTVGARVARRTILGVRAPR